MTINDMRNYISNEYPDSIGWHRKVMKMPTNQVIAIYKSMSNRKKKAKPVEPEYHQMDMFEYMTLLAIENSWTGSHTEIKC